MTQKAVLVDLETRSRVNLEACNIDRYARHPSTEVLCMSWKLREKGSIIRTWLPTHEVPDIFYEPGLILFSHNTTFEELIFRHVMRKHGFPLYQQKQWRCTMVQAAYLNLPRKLSEVCTFLDLEYQKDKEGNAVMKRLCRPQQVGKVQAKKLGIPENERKVTEVDGIFYGGAFDENLDKHVKLHAYCEQDVRAEEALHENLPFTLDRREKKLWFLDRLINQRGIPIDLDFCHGAMKIQAKAHEDGCRRLSEITSGRICSPDQVRAMPAELAKYGIVIPNMQAETVEEYLKKTDLPTEARDILRLRAELSFKAHKKFEAAICNVSPDGRLREQIQFYQASTGRWGGRGVQLHNLKRPVEKWPSPGVVEAIKNADPVLLQMLVDDHNKTYGTTMTLIDALSCSIRSMICPPEGFELAISDYAAIEARVLSWLAGCKVQLKQFQNGEDVYLGLASKIYRIPLEQMSKKTHAAERQVGKAGILGLGYGMGAVKFAGTLGVGKDDVKPFHYDVVSTYRGTYPEIPEFWKTLERAALYTVKSGKHCMGGPIEFRMEDKWLTLRLPSGRKLFYFRPFITAGKFGDVVAYYGARHAEVMWGGVWTENVVQATARDLLACAIIVANNQGLKTILHVHDEMVNEIEEGNKWQLEETHRIMSYVPSWAEGCPVEAETHAEKRYCK